MRNYFKPSDFSGPSGCPTRRKYPKLQKGRDVSVYKKAGVISNIIRDILLKGVFDRVWLAEKINEVFYGTEEEAALVKYETPETTRLHALATFNQIERYTVAELALRRKFVIPPMLVETLAPDCEVEVRPTFLFFGTKLYERKQRVYDRQSKKYHTEVFYDPKPYVEAVKLCTGKPRMSQKAAWSSAELACYLRYARRYAEEHLQKEMGDAPEFVIEASFYYLAKNNDSKGTFQPDFFDTAYSGNIVTISETRSYGVMRQEGFDLYKKFDEMFSDFAKGGECCKRNCEACDFYALCNFTKPSIVVEQECKQTPMRNVILTPAQSAVIGFRKGIGLCNSGPGSGKTFVLVYRAVSMLGEGVPPECILFVTFTNTGALEMRERIRFYLEDEGLDIDVDKILCVTFNALGQMIIDQNYQVFGFTESPRLIDEIERASIVSELLKKVVIKGLDYKNFKMNIHGAKGALFTVIGAFDIIKKEMLSIGDEEKLARLMNENGLYMDVPLRFQFDEGGDLHVNETEESCLDGYRQMLDLYQEYDQILKQNNLIEYADQEILVLDLLNKNPYYFEDWGIKHIIVDEAQDTNLEQLNIVKRVMDTPAWESTLYVGDDMQSIFAFRGADPGIITHFWKLMGTKGEEFFLLENHRSTPQVVDYANKVSVRNENRVPKNLIATRPSGRPVVIRNFYEKAAETRWIVDLIKAKHVVDGFPWEAIAYIASTRAELLKMGTALTDNGIPWIMLNPEPMLENSRVVAALALARVFRDPGDTQSGIVYLNALSRNTILEKTNEEIESALADLQNEVSTIITLPDKAALQIFINKVKLLEDADEIFDKFEEQLFCRGSLEETLKYAADYEEFGVNQTGKRDLSYPGVVLTTAHSSKGMEWPVVINAISGYDRNGLSKDEAEERRRLLFVSATRARDELFITGQTYVSGNKKDGYRHNRFLEESFEDLGKNMVPEIESQKKVTKKTWEEMTTLFCCRNGEQVDMVCSAAFANEAGALLSSKGVRISDKVPFTKEEIEATLVTEETVDPVSAEGTQVSSKVKESVVEESHAPMKEAEAPASVVSGLENDILSSIGALFNDNQAVNNEEVTETRTELPKATEANKKKEESLNIGSDDFDISSVLAAMNLSF